MNRILHVTPDEKFINSVIWQFEKVLPNESTYVVSIPHSSYNLKHVTQSERVDLLIANRKKIKEFVKNIDNYSLIFLHGMDIVNAQIILNYRGKGKIIWVFWGWEIYDNPQAEASNVIGNLTKKKGLHKKEKKTFDKKIKEILYYLLCFRLFSYGSLILKAIKRVNYVGLLSKQEFDFLVKKKYLNPNARFFSYTYYPIEFIFKGIELLNVTSDNILLGNSASATNNHIEAFEILHKFNIGHRKIITPLSYGDTEYKLQILKYGSIYFKNNFEPINDFMPLKDYNLYLQKCGIVIMNHYRSQAVGNILAMLWMGAKINLDESNIIYNLLKSWGLRVFSINKDLTEINIEKFDLLTETDRLHNRRILMEVIGEKSVLESLKNQIEAILNEY